MQRRDMTHTSPLNRLDCSYRRRPGPETINSLGMRQLDGASFHP